MDSIAYEVIPGLLYGRLGPARQSWSLEFFQRKGLKAIISLVPTDAKDITGYGIRHYYLPFEEKLSHPYKTENQFVLTLFHQAENIIDSHLSRQEAVLIHCNAGKDRTGIILALYLVKHNVWTARKVLTYRRRLNPEVLTGKGYEEVFEILAAKLGVRS